MALSEGEASSASRFLQLASNSFVLASVTALLAAGLALLLAYAARMSPARWPPLR